MNKLKTQELHFHLASSSWSPIKAFGAFMLTNRDVLNMHGLYGGTTFLKFGFFFLLYTFGYLIISIQSLLSIFVGRQKLILGYKALCMDLSSLNKDLVDLAQISQQLPTTTTPSGYFYWLLGVSVVGIAVVVALVGIYLVYFPGSVTPGGGVGGNTLDLPAVISEPVKIVDFAEISRQLLVLQVKISKLTSAITKIAKKVIQLEERLNLNTLSVGGIEQLSTVVETSSAAVGLL